MKNLLKKILPVPLLKEAFLVYNKLRIRTIDRMVFPEFRIDTSRFLLFRNGFPVRELNVSLDDLPENGAKKLMLEWYDWKQEEFVLVFDQTCVIEPKYGWAIVRPNRLIYYSFGVSRTWTQRKPGLSGLLSRPSRHLKKAISLRDSGEENYFHFYNDVVTKLFFLRHHGIDVTAFPIIIAKKLWDREYFKYYFERSPFMQSLEWIVQDRDHIECENVIFCKPLTHRQDLWTEVLAPLVKTGNGDRRKIFLTRSKSRLRHLENAVEIASVCRKEQFEIIDTDLLSLAEQIEVFSTASCIVGIHGAGLTNMVFAQAPCKVLEIFPPADRGYLPYHYILLAKMRGFHYYPLIGEPGKSKYSGGFFLDTNIFQQALHNFGL